MQLHNLRCDPGRGNFLLVFGRRGKTNGKGDEVESQERKW